MIEIHVNERDQFDHERLQGYLEQYDYRVDWQDKICCCQPCGSA